SCVVPSLKVPVALNCFVPPTVTVGFGGVTAIDWSTTAVTVSVVEPETAPLVALIVLVPAFTAVASPVALIAAVAGVPDVHVTVLVKSCVVPSLKVPVALNCFVPPTVTVGFGGVTAMDCKTAPDVTPVPDKPNEVLASELASVMTSTRL